MAIGGYNDINSLKYPKAVVSASSMPSGNVSICGTPKTLKTELKNLSMKVSK